MDETRTPGQAAYEATVTQAVIDGHGIGKYPAYDQLEPWQRRRWEAAAQAVIEAAPPRVITCDHSPAELGVTVHGTSRSERVAELAAEDGELREECDRLADLARGNPDPTVAFLESQADHFRELLAEILGDCPGCGFWHGPPTGRDQVAEWRKRAGLTSAPAVVTAGTEHLVPLIRDLTIPDEL